MASKITAKHKKIIKISIIALFVLIGMFEGLFFYVNSSVKPESYQQQIVDAIKKQTGLDVKINGDIRFSLLPSPRLLFSDLEVDTNSSKVSSVPNFSIERVEVYISTMSVLSSNIKLTSVNLIHPKLSFKRADDNTIHWEWLNLNLIKALNTKGKGDTSLPLFISDGVLHYKDAKNGKEVLIKNIDAHTVFGEQIVLNGTMDSGEKTLDFSVDSGKSDLPMTEAEFPLNLHVSGGKESLLQVNSVIDSMGDLLKISGKFDVKTDDLWGWITLPEQDNKDKNAKIQPDINRTPMPVAVTGAWNLNAGAIQMKDIIVEGLNSKGKGTAGVAWNNWYPTISADLDFESIDYVVWKKLLDNTIVTKAPKKIDEFQSDEVQSFDFRKENPLPENIEVKLNVNAKKILFGKEEWGNTHLSAVLDKGAFTINQCDIALDGDGVISIFGVISQGGTGKLRFEGNMEAKGKSLHKAISMFYSSASDLPAVGEGEFLIRANVYINSEQIRMFEMSTTIDGVPVSGTVTTYLEAQPRIELKIKLKNVNFDYVRDSLRKQNIEAKSKENIAKGSATSKIGFDWLKNLSTKMDFGVYVEGFTFMGRTGDRASFSVSAHRGVLQVSNVQFMYPDGTNDVNCILDVRRSLPYINLIVNADRIDTSYFDIDPKTEEELAAENAKSKNGAGKKSYVDAPIPLEWMDSFNGVFDISLRKLVHSDLFIENIKFQGTLENRIMTMRRLGFVYSHAQSNIVGTVYGGKVPGIRATFTMANADIYELLRQLVGLENISGYTNLSGVVSTSGYNLREWLGHMNSQILIAARGVKVQGINIAGVSDVVNVARSSADVVNNVNNVLTKGATDFVVDGSLNIKDGEIRAPSLVLRSGLVTGMIVGGAKLETMVGQFSMNFSFPNLSPDVVPTMIVQLSGSMDKPELKVDTAALEYFVAKKNVAR